MTGTWPDGAGKCQPAGVWKAIEDCPLCGMQPGTKIGPPARARCVTNGCEGRNLAAETIDGWNSRIRSTFPMTPAKDATALADKLCPVCSSTDKWRCGEEGCPRPSGEDEIERLQLELAALRAAPQTPDAGQQALGEELNSLFDRYLLTDDEGENEAARVELADTLWDNKAGIIAYLRRSTPSASAGPQAEAVSKLPDEEAAGKTATRLLDQWSEIEGAENFGPYRETMAFLGKPNSAGWVWAHEVRFERDFDSERKRNNDLTMEAIAYAESLAHPQPQQADGRDLVWRIRVREGSKTYHVYTERLPFEPDADSNIVILGEPVAFAQADGPAK